MSFSILRRLIKVLNAFSCQMRANLLTVKRSRTRHQLMCTDMQKCFCSGGNVEHNSLFWLQISYDREILQNIENFIIT